ncbi:MAG: WD40 repeat domain-containing protein [Fuerstia sp.]|nr:WD40 repeat domain-containing protein [Fuerstiella sp.]
MSLALCLPGLSAVCVAREKADTYPQVINAAQSDLAAGRMADARKRLDATAHAQRSFEHEYLNARAAAGTEGTAAPELIRRVAKPDVETRYGILDPVNRQMVYICRDGGLRIHDLSVPEKSASVKKHPQDSMIWSGAFSHDGKRFFTGHQNGEVLVWNAATWEIEHTVSLGQDWPVRELAVAPDGSAFVGESKAALELWSLSGEQPSKVSAVGERYNFGEGLAFSAAGDMLATGGMFDIILHDATTGKQIRSMRHASYTMGLEFSPDGRMIASAPRGNVNKFLAVFDVKQDEPLFNAGPFGNYVVGMSFSPDGKRIAATGCEKMLRLFDATTGDVVLSIDRTECGSKPAFTHDGRLLGWNEPAGFLFIELGQKP